MPGARWFPEVSLNYAENMLRLSGREDDEVVVFGVSQARPTVSLTAAELRDQVARARNGLIRLGVENGDRVAAYAPNIPETLVLLLATASLGAVFTSCAPEFGTRSVIDRWLQIEPKVFLAIDGYRYGSKRIDRRAQVAAIRAALPSVQATIWLPYAGEEPIAVSEGALSWDEFLSEAGPLEFDRLPFDHPLWVLFSSGTTGLPKPIVHSQGGMIIEQLKSSVLEMDLGAGDRFFWFSTTGWTMWNLLVSGLLSSASVVLFDGDPAFPDPAALWQLAIDLEVTYFGTSATALMAAKRAALEPRRLGDLSALRTVGSTGSPLPPDGFRWVYEAVKGDVVVASLSGGTDVCTGFVGASPLLPVYAGEFACRCLGAAVAAYDTEGRSVLGEVGELVVTEPMPTMPIGFWNDHDGSRYRAAYFEFYPGVWRHGDWITLQADGTGVITGRSDATLNRGGVRLGTADFYAVVDVLPGVDDSLVIHLEDSDGGPGRLLLFVASAESDGADPELADKIKLELRTKLSPRHVPDDVRFVPSVPRTLSGKKLEVPVKRILRGERVSDVASVDALTDPHSLDAYEALRSTL